jgi:repressor LexA
MLSLLFMSNTRGPNGFITWGMILRYIYESTQEQGFPPTYREMADTLGVVSTSSVAHHVDILEARKLVTRKPGCPRTLKVTEAGRNILIKSEKKVSG